MVVFYLTNTALDIASGVLWWITKNTLMGVYYGGKYMIYGSTPAPTHVSAYAALPGGVDTNSLQKQISVLNDKLNMISQN